MSHLKAGKRASDSIDIEHNKRKHDVKVVVSTESRSLRESDPDPDFDPNVISKMSPRLRDKIHNDPYSCKNMDDPLEKYHSEKNLKCKSFWWSFCCCCCSKSNPYEKGNRNNSSNSLNRSSDDDSVILGGKSSKHPFYPTLESTNIVEKHKKSKTKAKS